MSGPNGFRGKHQPFRIEPCRGQAAENEIEPPKREFVHVFQEDESRSNLANDSLDVRPEPARVVDAKALSGRGDGLAREARNDEIHDATPGVAVEAREIRPHRRRIQGARLAARCQEFDGKGFPLDVADRSSVRNGEPDSEVEPSSTGAEGEHVEGT